MGSQGYTPEQRSRNQLSIILTSTLVFAVAVLSGLMQSWPLGSYVVVAVVIATVAAVCWWLFTGPTAAPLEPGRQQARWPYLSKKKLDEISGN